MASYQRKLDDIVDVVEGAFTTQIQDLNNSEVEYVLEQLVSWFQLQLDRVQAGSREETGE